MDLLFLVHPCDEDDKAGCEGKCVKDGDSFHCSCEKGFFLADDKKKCLKGKSICLRNNE